jgi:hypothetical protein
LGEKKEVKNRKMAIYLRKLKKTFPPFLKSSFGGRFSVLGEKSW